MTEGMTLSLFIGSSPSSIAAWLAVGELGDAAGPPFFPLALAPFFAGAAFSSSLATSGAGVIIAFEPSTSLPDPPPLLPPLDLESSLSLSGCA